ncbi:MAG: hypothetical protein ABFC34_10805 [Methanobacterium sp.]
MKNEEIAALNEERKELHLEYNKVVVEYLKFKDQYISKMSGLGEKIHIVDAKLKRLRTPVEE